MKLITKQILATSVTGTLALMGAPAEKPQPDAAAEVSSAGETAFLLRGTLVFEGNSYFIKDADGKQHEVKLIAADKKDAERLKNAIGTTRNVSGKFAKDGKVVIADRTIFPKSDKAAAAARNTKGGHTGAAVFAGSAAAAGTVAGLFVSGTLESKDEKPASRP